MAEPIRPAFDEDDLRRTVRSFTGAGDDAGQDIGLRFMRGVAKLIRRHAARGSAPSGARAIFLLRPVPPESLGPVQRRFQLESEDTVIEGHLWFVSAAPTGGSCTP